MWSNIKNVLWSGLSRQIYHVLGYLLLSWMSYVALVSIVIFFHFSLGHNLSVIDQWIFDEGWKLIVLCKLLALFPVLKFTFLNWTEKKPVWHFLKKTYKTPRREVFVALVVFLVLLLILGQPKLISTNEFDVFKLFWSYLGTSVYYLTDVFLFLVLTTIFETNVKEKGLLALCFVFISQIINTKIFAYGANFSVFVSYAYLFLFYLSLWRSPNWVDAAVFVGLGLAPMASVFGIDAFWGAEFSPLYMKGGISSLEFFFILLTLTGYLFYRHRSLNIS